MITLKLVDQVEGYLKETRKALRKKDQVLAKSFLRAAMERCQDEVGGLLPILHPPTPVAEERKPLTTSERARVLEAMKKDTPPKPLKELVDASVEIIERELARGGWRDDGTQLFILSPGRYVGPDFVAALKEKHLASDVWISKAIGNFAGTDSATEQQFAGQKPWQVLLSK